MCSKTWIEQVSSLLVGRTVRAVVECEVPSMDEEGMVDSEGIVLVLDNGTHVRVAVDYEDVDFIVDEVTPSLFEGLVGEE